MYYNLLRNMGVVVTKRNKQRMTYKNNFMTNILQKI
jgi:hypothetical protein